LSNARTWLFRGLVIAATGLILLSWFMPWWRADITMLNNWVQIRPYGLEMDPFTAGYFPSAKMPGYFAPFIWAYFGIIMALVLFSLFVKERIISLGKLKISLPKLIFGGVGLSFIFVAILAVIVAAIRTGDYYGMHLLGRQMVEVDPELGAESLVIPRFLFGYYMAYVAGLFCIVLALLRDRITGKNKVKVDK